MAISRRRLLGGLVASVSLAGLMLASPGRAQSVRSTYDALGRLSTVTYPDGRVTTYTYDPAGNRTQVTTAVPPPLSASVSPTYWTGDSGYSDPPVVVTASGGVTPYVYLWQRTSGDPNLRPATSGAASTTFYYLDGPPPSTATASWRCRVTDALGTIAYTSSVNVTLEP